MPTDKDKQSPGPRLSADLRRRLVAAVMDREAARRKEVPVIPADAIDKTARKIADDLRGRWNLRARGDLRKLRPNEIDIMAKQESEIDRLIARRIKKLLLAYGQRDHAER